MGTDDSCLFCKIVPRRLDVAIVFEDDISLAFLDHRPLFHGHTLLVPKQHFEVLNDLPPKLVAPFFTNVQFLSVAVQSAMNAEGTFVAMNNVVSQSVPHLHVHIVPRRRKDGLKGFFWPRTKYGNVEELADVQQKIVARVAELRS